MTDRASGRRKPKKERRVLVFGVFDILHPGHVAFLEAAAAYGDELIVVVTRDAKAAREKGRRPLHTLAERLRMLEAIEVVDRVIPGDPGARWTAVERERPDVICVGHDQNAEHPAFLAQLERLDKEPEIVRLKAERPKRYRSSRLREGGEAKE